MATDVTQWIKASDQLQKRLIDAVRLGVNQAGEHVLGDAQTLTPVDTAFLQNSATAKGATFDGGKVEKIIGFNAEYAAAVHEVLTSKHPTGQAKFLETAMRRNLAKVNAFIADEVRSAMS